MGALGNNFIKMKKTFFSARYFQYGMFEFPLYLTDRVNTLYASGKALKHCDGDTLLFSI